MTRPSPLLPILAILAAFGLLLGLASTTGAAFTDTTGNSPNLFDAADVVLYDDDAGAAAFTVTDLRPGQTDTRCVTVTYEGSAPADIRMYSAGAPTDLAAALSVTITMGQGGSFAGCSGFTALAPVYTGTLSGLLTDQVDFATGAQVWQTGDAPDSRTYQVTTELASSDNALQGLATGPVDLIWEAQSLTAEQWQLIVDSAAAPAETDPSAAVMATAALWLDADSLALADGDPVTAWPSSTGGLTLGQQTPTAQPTFGSSSGLSHVAFDGTQDYLSAGTVAGSTFLDDDQAAWYFMVRQLGSDPTNVLLHWSPDYTWQRAVVHATWHDPSYINAFIIDHGSNIAGAGRSVVSQPVGWDDSWHLLEYHRNGAVAEIIVDGVTLHTSSQSQALGTNLSAELTMGLPGGASFGGDIAHVALFRAAHGADDRALIRTRLAGSRLGL